MEESSPRQRLAGAIRLAGAFAPLLTFLVLFGFFSVATDRFLTPDNLYNILAQNAVLAAMAVGMTFVLICAQIDLSVAAVAGLSGVVCAACYKALGEAAPDLAPLWAESISITAALVLCLVIGVLNGIGTAYCGLPSFMMTLSMWMIADGLSRLITRNTPIFVLPESLSALSENRLGPLPTIVLPPVVLLLIGFCILRYSRFGRHNYTVGSNPVAARLSGVNPKLVLTATMTLCSFTAGVGGLLFIGRAGSAQVDATEPLLIDCVSAVVIGGTSLFGGRGGIANTVIGLLTFGTLKNGLNHLDVDIHAKVLITGVILLGALLLNVAVARLRETR